MNLICILKLNSNFNTINKAEKKLKAFARFSVDTYDLKLFLD